MPEAESCPLIGSPSWISSSILDILSSSTCRLSTSGMGSSGLARAPVPHHDDDEHAPECYVTSATDWNLVGWR